MDRRNVLEFLAAAGIATSAAARAADEPAMPAGHEHHHDHAAATGRYAALIADTTACINAGESLPGALRDAARRG